MIPFVTSFPFTYRTPEAMSARITRIIAENPGPFTFTGTGTYLVGGEQSVAVIDPGPDRQDHLEAILTHSPGPITHIVITHTHRDHSALASALKEKTGAPIYGFGAHPTAPGEAPMALDEGADFDFEADVPIRDGDIITGPGWTLTAVGTPGHTGNHLCFCLEEEQVLFTGDHMMGWSTTVVAPPDGNMGDYMESLETLLRREDQRYYPTHGAPIDDPKPFVEAVKAHRQKRDAEIVAALTKAPQSPKDIAEKVYTDIDKALLPAASLNVMAHLAMHLKAERIQKNSDGFYITPK